MYFNNGFQYTVHPTMMPVLRNPFEFKTALNLFF